MFSSKAGTGFARNLRHDMFERVQSFAFENIDKFSSSSLVTRMTTDVNSVQMAFMMLTRIAVRAPLMLIFSITMAYIMGGALATSFVVIIPVLAFGLIMIGKKAMPAFRAVFKKYDRMNASIEENVRAMRVVKGFSREEYEKEKFAVSSDNIAADFTKAERIVACNMPLMQLCMYFNMVFVLFVGSRIVVQSQGSLIKVGQISAMLTYGVQILMSLMMLSMIYVMLTMSIEAAKRICEVLDEEPTLHNPVSPVTEVKDGSIDFCDVSFKYSAAAQKYALSDIDLHIASGMTVGILGVTGSSKSTLVQLIPRLYDVTEGAVKVGGVDVRDYDLEALREAVAMVLQKNELFSGTIRDNLRWGNPEASREECEQACRIACAHEFIAQMPHGYDTRIEQGGTNVSGGQRQRLCIARALLKKPKVLVLDDSTSACDNDTDRLIRSALAQQLNNVTKIIISQRISSIKDCDRILVLNNGRMHGWGTHEDLLKGNNLYKEIYSLQNDDSGDFDDSTRKEGMA